MQKYSVSAGQAVEPTVAAFCKKHDVPQKNCDTLTAQMVSYLKSQKPKADGSASGGTPCGFDFDTMVDVKSKWGGPPQKQPLKIAKGAVIEDTVRSFCTKHEVSDGDCKPLSAQVVKYLKSQGSKAPAAAATGKAASTPGPAPATDAGTASPIDFKTDIDVKSKSGGPSKKQPFSIKAGQTIESVVEGFCTTHEVKATDCAPLKKSIVSYLAKQKPAAGGAAPAPAASSGAGTASPIDFETKVDVKSKSGGPTKKQLLKIAKGAAIEAAVQSFCTTHEVKQTDCTPLIGQVVSYLKSKGAAAGPAPASAPAGGAGTPSPIAFETMVNVKSKSTGGQSKQNMKIAKGEAIEGAVASFCKKHDVTDADCSPLTAQVVKYLKSRK
jgi:hypothetical protein